MELSIDEQRELLRIARASIESAVAGKQSSFQPSMTPQLALNCGAFVTLHAHGELRGCIGYIEGIMPLAETVREVAAKAALEDPRFPPVRTPEVHSIDIEISVMSPLQEVKDTSEIVIGRDGLLVESGYHRGLLLPQVATEYGWNRVEFLRQTCVKARLAPDAWQRTSTKILRFSVILFSEHDKGGME
ncbi:MAG: AmmeMemoRadiSam system protein A [Ignavibacteriales bacterium]|nr:AmmeMemoRadiSam system protein A [Ignavibacteriales bacterium]